MWYRVKNGACGGGGSRTDSKNLFVTPSLKWQVEKRQRHHSWATGGTTGFSNLNKPIAISIIETRCPEMEWTKPWNHETITPMVISMSQRWSAPLSKLPKVKTSVLKNLLIFGENSSHKAPICLNLADFWLNTHVSYEGLPLCIIGSFVHWV